MFDSHNLRDGAAGARKEEEEDELRFHKCMKSVFHQN